jgi:prephenate dehydrogenase
MAVQLTIIGLGQIGASIGMALKDRKDSIRRVGYDKNSAVAKASESLDVVDEIRNLKEAVKDAGIVLLALPLSEIHETLKHIGPELQENTVVLDTAPVKSSVKEWAKEFIPAGRFYLGLVPALKSESFASTESGLNAASPDLFKRTVMIVDAPPGIPQDVEQLAMNLVRLIGAKPMLTDLAESDGLMASVHLLPQLTAAALLVATVDQAGWAEARKLAGKPYAGVTGGLAYYDDVASLKSAALANRSNIVHALDMMIASLTGLREDIHNGDDKSVDERLQQAYDSRERWLDERSAADWLKEGGDPIELPNLGDQILQTLFGSRIIDRNKKKAN